MCRWTVAMGFCSHGERAGSTQIGQKGFIAKEQEQTLNGKSLRENLGGEGSSSVELLLEIVQGG